MMSACINSSMLWNVLCNRRNCILSLALIAALRSGGVSYIGVDVIPFIALFQVCGAISTGQCYSTLLAITKDENCSII